jgi:hypothetical protein
MNDPDSMATAISEARSALLEFAANCSDEQWRSSPLGDADPRPVCVIVDHVAHSYEYIGGWVRSLLSGETVEVSPEMVDVLNSEHASVSTSPGREEVADHLRDSGEALIDLVRGLEPEQLAIDNGRVEQLVKIAARHADGHRSELESALQEV